MLISVSLLALTLAYPYIMCDGLFAVRFSLEILLHKAIANASPRFYKFWINLLCFNDDHSRFDYPILDSFAPLAKSENHLDLSTLSCVSCFVIA